MDGMERVIALSSCIVRAGVTLLLGVGLCVPASRMRAPADGDQYPDRIAGVR
jgi:hypothetical protein